MVANVMKKKTTIIQNQIDCFSVDIGAEEFAEVWPKLEDTMMMKEMQVQKKEFDICGL